MKNIIYTVIIIACVGLIYVGLTRKNTPPAAQNTVATTGSEAVSTDTVKPTNSSTAAVAIGQNVEHFRPDAATPTSAATPAQSAERNFQLTPDLLAKMYLIDKYKPGTCFGLPAPVPQIAITNLVASNPPLSSYLRQKYGLKTDLEVYNKYKQLQGVTLTETASSKYNFAFTDGQCQTEVHYEGVVTVSNNNVSATVLSQDSYTYQ